MHDPTDPYDPLVDPNPNERLRVGLVQVYETAAQLEGEQEVAEAALVDAVLAQANALYAIGVCLLADPPKAAAFKPVDFDAAIADLHDDDEAATRIAKLEAELRNARKSCDEWAARAKSARSAPTAAWHRIDELQAECARQREQLAETAEMLERVRGSADQAVSIGELAADEVARLRDGIASAAEATGLARVPGTTTLAWLDAGIRSLRRELAAAEQHRVALADRVLAAEAQRDAQGLADAGNPIRADQGKAAPPIDETKLPPGWVDSPFEVGCANRSISTHAAHGFVVRSEGREQGCHMTMYFGPEDLQALDYLRAKFAAGPAEKKS